MSAVAEIRRPVMRYHGGKARLAPWLISLFPRHCVYVEAFGGAASVLMLKPRAYAEIYNDLDDQVARTFRVLRDPLQAEQLRARLELTPYSRREFQDAYSPPIDDLDCAAKLLTRSFMGFGSAGTRNSSTGFRLSVRYRGTHQAKDWSRYPAVIPSFTARLRDVVIENRDAIAVMSALDSPDTLHYCDPPYVHSTRSSLRYKSERSNHYYRHDMDDAGHRRLAEFLRTVSGMVVLSGYRSALYDELYGDWTRLERNHMADGAKPRVECVWLNPAASEQRPQQSLLDSLERGAQ